MEKSKLIDLLFETFDKEKNTIKKNLMMYMNNIWLQAKDKDIKVTLKIEVEKCDK